MKKNTSNDALVVLYHHPERFPPTLNAVHELCQIYTLVTLVFRCTNQSVWPYPPNVKLAGDNQWLDSAEQEQLSIWGKLRLFAKFTLHLRRSLIQSKPKLLLIYDSMAFLAFYLIRWSIKTPQLVWYHSHDIPSFAALRKYSISWWAAMVERKKVQQVDVFSLPSLERKVFFELDHFRGDFFYLPNLPSLHFYQPFYTKQFAPSGEVNLLYQGAVNADHGLEAIIQALPFLNARLSIIGPATPAYQESLVALSKTHGVENRVFFFGRINYQHLPNLTKAGQIGLALLTNTQNFNHTTAATASNKIYEYAALGLPVLYYQDDAFEAALAHYAWAKGTDLSLGSIKTSIAEIISSYEELSTSAHQDFLDTLNYELLFKPIQARLLGETNL